MENACWNCGELHPNRECDKNKLDVQFRRQVQVLRKHGIDQDRERNKMFSQLQKYEQRKSEASILPPESLLKYETERLHSFIYQLSSDIKDLGLLETGFNTDVGVIEVNLNEAMGAKKKLESELENIRLLRRYKKECENKWKMNFDLDIMYAKIDDVSTSQRLLNDKLYRIVGNLTAALKVLTDWNTTTAEVSDYIRQGMDAYESGRPLRIKEFETPWMTHKDRFKKTKECIAKHLYLFNAVACSKIDTQLEVMTTAWKLLKKAKQDAKTEIGEMGKIICKICITNDIGVTLNCGHVFCEICLGDIQPDENGQRSCPFCRHIITQTIRIFF